MASTHSWEKVTHLFIREAGWNHNVGVLFLLPNLYMNMYYFYGTVQCHQLKVFYAPQYMPDA